MNYKDKKKGWFQLQADSMLWEQGGRCAICNMELRGKTCRDGRKAACVDHDHQTGEVRGILCTRCNTVLAWYERYKKHVDLYLDK